MNNSISYIKLSEDFEKVKDPSLLLDDRVLEKPYSVNEVFEFLLNRGALAA